MSEPTTKAQRREQDAFYLEYLSAIGWTQTDAARAIGYATSDGLKFALERNGLPADKSARLVDVAEMAAAGRLLPVKAKVGLDDPLPLLPDGQPVQAPPLSRPVPAPRAAATVSAPASPAATAPALARPLGTLEVFNESRRDLERIVARLREHEPHAVPVVRPGIEVAIRKAEDLLKFLDIR